MGLFLRHRDENTGQHLAPAYTIGSEKSLVIVGLGNHEKEYDSTRHNIGFAALDTFAELNDMPAWATKKDLKCLLSQHTLGDTRVILIKPTTFMNRSGEAVQAVLKFYKIPVQNTIIVHDELDLPFGLIRTQKGGGAAGHNGVKSVIEHCGDEFGRVRIGIKNELRSRMDGADFVLGKFTAEEQAHMKALTQEVSAILSEAIFGNGLVPETRQFLVET